MASKKKGNPVGRPSKFTDEVRRKIEEVAALDGSVEEMAYYADVDRTSIYNFFKEDREFFNRIEKLRARPILKARQAAIKHLEDSYTNAIDYLKRKRKAEFGDNLDISTLGKSLPTAIIPLNVQSNNSNE
jgi:hypothetical protein